MSSEPTDLFSKTAQEEMFTRFRVYENEIAKLKKENEELKRKLEPNNDTKLAKFEKLTKDTAVDNEKLKEWLQSKGISEKNIESLLN